MIEIYLAIYRCYVRIYWPQNKEDYEALVRKAKKDDTYTVSKHADWCTCPIWVFDWDKLCFIMYIENSNKIHVFVHELYHIVCAIQYEFWLEEEACAYIISYIVEEYNNSFKW